ncbi:O-antigen ligase family protein [Roseimicrobium sp. ORNL1]|uniref:O-antigen ligase family protein n=1 Tax=Roseimicrobium sp. ORNL1 TaxID=2711231 RepID=UPI0013E17DCD|nr:O-antigen ligase family protein [Roseimicrobium sp. ORNL1]QIF02451.1 O-antigen ligase family protein [Roseimicrobium sp. ORNL1]
MRDYFFEGQLRLDWGFGNPNTTGALIAVLMIGAWLLAFWGRWGFWLSLLINVGLGACLVQTYSRGALVALIVGLVPLICVARRPWRRSQLIGIVVALMLLGGYAWQQRATQRYAKGIVTEDGSVSNRWLIYRMAPRMMWDAPEGWGWGRSGDAFRQWYQPTGRLEHYTHLISTHGTWLVEWGWPLRVSYVAAWALALTLCWPGKRNRWLAVGLGVTLSFAVSCTFTHVGREKWLWAGPAAALLLAVGARLWTRDFSWRRTIAATLGASAAVVALLVIWAQVVQPAHRIHLRRGVVEVGTAAPGATRAIGLLQPDHRVVGQFYGQRIRETLSTAEGTTLSFHVQWTADAVLNSGLDTVVVAGDAARGIANPLGSALSSARAVLLINPSEPSPQFAELVPKLPRVHQVHGQMWGGTSRYLWEALLASHERATTAQLPMSSLFVPKWTSCLVIPEIPGKS